MLPLTQYYTTFIPCRNVNSVQPFGWIGGAPALMRALSIEVMFSRLNYGYTHRSLQNCQLLVLTSCLQEDSLVHSVEQTMVKLRQDDASGAPESPPLSQKVPKWLVNQKPNRGGMYGPTYLKAFQELHREQGWASVIEQAVLQPVTGDTPRPTGLGAFATVQYEVPVPGSMLRYLTSDEWFVALEVAKTTWMAQLSAFARTSTPQDTDVQAAVSTVQAQHVTAETARLLQLYEAAKAAPPAPMPAAPFAAPDMFFNMTLLCGHPGRPGIGQHTLERVCALADAMGRGVLLCAVHSGMTLTYYARLGFRAVVWLGKTAPKTLAPTLQAQGWVHMWRQAREAGAGVVVADEDGGDSRVPQFTDALLNHSQGLSYHVEQDAAPDGPVVDGRQHLTVTQRVSFPPKKDPRSQLDMVHLSVDTEDSLLGLVAMKGPEVALSASWALEMLRLLRDKRTWAGCAVVWSAGSDIPDPALYGGQAGGGAGAKRSREVSNGGSDDASPRPVRMQPFQRRHAPATSATATPAAGGSDAAEASTVVEHTVHAHEAQQTSTLALPTSTAALTPPPVVHMHFTQPGTYYLTIAWTNGV